jgi:hypothetical protein
VNVFSPPQCLQQCACHGYAFAGVQNGHECWCGHTFCSLGPATSPSIIGRSSSSNNSHSCNLPCPNGEAEGCGGVFTNSVYATAGWVCAAVPCSSTSSAFDTARGYEWCNASLSVAARVQALLANFTLAEKAGLFGNSASGVPRLGLPAYNW